MMEPLRIVDMSFPSLVIGLFIVYDLLHSRVAPQLVWNNFIGLGYANWFPKFQVAVFCLCEAPVCSCDDESDSTNAGCGWKKVNFIAAFEW